jgi:hypothetical protein
MGRGPSREDYSRVLGWLKFRTRPRYWPPPAHRRHRNQGRRCTISTKPGAQPRAVPFSRRSESLLFVYARPSSRLRRPRLLDPSPVRQMYHSPLRWGSTCFLFYSWTAPQLCSTRTLPLVVLYTTGILLQDAAPISLVRGKPVSSFFFFCGRCPLIKPPPPSALQPHRSPQPPVPSSTSTKLTHS